MMASVLAARRHLAIVLILAAAACLLCTQLGRDYFWEDEGDTAVLAASILAHGVPTAWDGTTLSAPDRGDRLTDGLVMVSHPWLQYYAAAGSFALFGRTPFAARLPFALAGLCTIAAVYGLMLGWIGNRPAALCAAALLTLNVQFLLFARQARNYSFNALLTCLLIWQFQRLDSATGAVLFAAVAILLFHAHPIGLWAALGLLLLTFVTPAFADKRRWIWRAALVVGLYAAPWLWLSRAGDARNLQPIAAAADLLPRLAQFLVEWASVTPAIGVLALCVWLRRKQRAQRRSARARQVSTSRPTIFSPDERAFIAASLAVIAAEAAGVVATHSANDLWVVGLHQSPAIIPLTAMLAGLSIVKAAAASRRTLAVLLLVFGMTQLPGAAPWTAWAAPVSLRDPDALATLHVPVKPVDRLLRTEDVAYARSLFQPNPGTIETIGRFLHRHAAPGDIVVTNYGWEALYFHTGLPQAMKIAPSFPIYTAAHARGLPAYVFSPAGVRWIVWRRAWPPAFPEQDCAALIARLQARGVPLKLVASLPETLYENRENIHFRRWADGTSTFQGYGSLPDVLIFRVGPASGLAPEED
jgi:4-amino-4-deoxy-L-arabinose transferase-like glycosyltransferase